jgi:hypothetical protein
MALEPGQIVNSYEEEEEAIMTRFGTNFDTSMVPVQYGNFGLYKKGNEVLQNPDDSDLWIRFNIIGGPGESPEITRSFTRVNGLIAITIFTQRGQGSRDAKRVADELFPLFNRVSFNGIKTDAASLVIGGYQDSWYQVNLTIPYRWERCLTQN